MKGLKEENFDLKLRIYLLEEKLAQCEADKMATNELKKKLKNSLYDTEDEDDESSEEDTKQSYSRPTVAAKKNAKTSNCFGSIYLDESEQDILVE